MARKSALLFPLPVAGSAEGAAAVWAQLQLAHLAVRLEQLLEAREVDRVRQVEHGNRAFRYRADVQPRIRLRAVLGRSVVRAVAVGVGERGRLGRRRRMER